jgi:hypothetical protein
MVTVVLYGIRYGTVLLGSMVKSKRYMTVSILNK